FAGLASAAFHIETEPSRLVSTRLGLGQGREEVADWCKEADVGCRIRPGSTADRILVDVDNFVDGIDSFDGAYPSNGQARPVQRIGNIRKENVGHQGRLTRTADPSNDGHCSKRESDVNSPQVVLLGTEDANALAIASTPVSGNRQF